MSDETTTNPPESMDGLKPGMALQGTVKHLALYGAFVDINTGRDALLHISQIGKPDVRNIEDVVKVGDEITVYVLKVDRKQNRVALSMEPTPSMTWDQLREGQQVQGTVVRIEKFGVFVDIGAERPGMVHVSELADGYVNSPEDVVSVGQDVEARILKVNRRQRKIDLTMKTQVEAVEEYLEEEEDDQPTAMAMAFRRAMEGQDDEDVDEMPPRQQPRRRREGRNNVEQEDIISRTLRDHQNGSN